MKLGYEYRLVRNFDLERDGIVGRDYVNLGRVTPEQAELKRREHRAFAKQVLLERRQVSLWYPFVPAPIEGRA